MNQLEPISWEVINEETTTSNIEPKSVDDIKDSEKHDNKLWPTVNADEDQKQEKVEPNVPENEKINNDITEKNKKKVVIEAELKPQKKPLEEAKIVWKALFKICLEHVKTAVDLFGSVQSDALAIVIRDKRVNAVKLYKPIVYLFECIISSHKTVDIN